MACLGLRLSASHSDSTSSSRALRDPSSDSEASIGGIALGSYALAFSFFFDTDVSLLLLDDDDDEEEEDLVLWSVGGVVAALIAVEEEEDDAPDPIAVVSLSLDLDLPLLSFLRTTGGPLTEEADDDEEEAETGSLGGLLVNGTSMSCSSLA